MILKQRFSHSSLQILLEGLLKCQLPGPTPEVLMVGLGWNPRVRVSNEILPLVMLPLAVPGPHFEKHCCDLKQWEKALVHHQ